MDSSPTALYRLTTLGTALQHSLAEFVKQNLINQQLQEHILLKFEDVLLEAVIPCNQKISIRGRLHTFRLYNGVWTFIVEKANIALNEGNEVADFLKIVAVEVPPSLLTRH